MTQIDYCQWSAETSMLLCGHVVACCASATRLLFLILSSTKELRTFKQINWVIVETNGVKRHDRRQTDNVIQYEK